MFIKNINYFLLINLFFFFFLEIDLPNNNYNWQLNDTSKGQIDDKGLFTGDTAPGDIELRVND